MKNLQEYNMEKNLIRNELKVEVYTVGFEPMGESIVVKIKMDKITMFCFVIDYYETEDEKPILQLIKDEQIDLICITHPDLDHCLGLEKVLQLATKDTIILYPDKMIEKKYDTSDQNIIKIVEKIF